MNIHIIYVLLKNEGTIVYKPVPANKIEKNIYQLQGIEIYDPEDEVWEFAPEEIVIVDSKKIDGELVLIAVAKYNKPNN